MKQFPDVEADLQGLDAEAWAFLKSEVAPLLRVRHPTRGWQFLFDKLNQAKAYNYLRGAGYPNVRFIPPSAVPGQQTPDLEADGVLCEVKTINALDAEANRRHSGGVGSVTDQLDSGPSPNSVAPPKMRKPSLGGGLRIVADSTAARIANRAVGSMRPNARVVGS